MAVSYRKRRHVAFDDIYQMLVDRQDGLRTNLLGEIEIEWYDGSGWNPLLDSTVTH